MDKGTIINYNRFASFLTHMFSIAVIFQKMRPKGDPLHMLHAQWFILGSLKPHQQVFQNIWIHVWLQKIPILDMVHGSHAINQNHTPLSIRYECAKCKRSNPCQFILTVPTHKFHHVAGLHAGHTPQYTSGWYKIYNGLVYLVCCWRQKSGGMIRKIPYITVILYQCIHYDIFNWHTLLWLGTMVLQVCPFCLPFSKKNKTFCIPLFFWTRGGPIKTFAIKAASLRQHSVRALCGLLRYYIVQVLCRETTA